MTTLRWPDGRGRFVDHDSDRVSAVDGVDDPPLDVAAGATVDVDSDDAVEHYLDRGFVRADDTDGSGGDTDAAESPDSDDFDAEAFTDRTPVSDVVEDIEAGDADGHLDAVADADDRVSVEQAVASRKDDVGGD